MTMHILDGVLGVFALVITAIYFDRCRLMAGGKHRLDYIALHVFLGFGSLACGIRLLLAVTTASEALPDPDTICQIFAAFCYLLVTHRRGRTFRPPTYMQSNRGDLS